MFYGISIIFPIYYSPMIAIPFATLTTTIIFNPLLPKRNIIRIKITRTHFKPVTNIFVIITRLHSCTTICNLFQWFSIFENAKDIRTCPIGYWISWNYQKIVLFSCIAIFSGKKHIFLSLLWSRLNQTIITPLITWNMAFSHNKTRSLNNFAANFFKCSWSQMSHIYGISSL